MLNPTLNVFIDGGGNHQNTVIQYLKDFPKFNRIYVFEPNPIFHSTYDNFILIKKAIWTSNCNLPFYLSQDEGLIGSSLIKNKLSRIDSQLIPSYWRDKPIEVECINFSEWLKNNIKSYYKVILKLDIEGAEYDVLTKLLKDGTIKYINKLYVEFHVVENKKSNKLIDELKKYIEVILWK